MKLARVALTRSTRAHAEELSRTSKPVYHFGLSLPEGEHLTQEEWSQAVDRVLDRMGLTDHQAMILAHNDTPYEHVHIMVNRVGEDGQLWEPYRDMVKARAEIREIEREYGLATTETRSPSCGGRRHCSAESLNQDWRSCCAST